MIKLLFILLFTMNLFGIVSDEQAQPQPLDKNTMIVQTPDTFQYESDDENKKCIPKNFYCPEVKYKKINKTTNTVLDSWYLEYDTKNITNINYRSGAYICNYSTNDVIQYRHTFTNESCQKELFTLKQEMQEGKKLFGFDYKTLTNDIKNIDNTNAKSSYEIARELDITTDDTAYDQKGYLTFSQMLSKILTFSTEVKGTDEKMNLVLSSESNTNSYSSNENTQSYVVSDNSGYTMLDNNVENDNKLFGRTDEDFASFVLNAIGITTSYEDRKTNILNSVWNLKELVNTQTFGYYINWLYINKDILYYVVLILLIVIMVKQGTIGGVSQIKEILGKMKPHNPERKDLITYGVVMLITGGLFMLPLNERNILINGDEKEYSTTPVQESVDMFTGIATKYADLTINRNAINITDYFNKISGIYTNDELNIFTDDIATNLIIAQRQNAFLNQQCKQAYNAGGDTFIKSRNDFALNTSYNLYTYGVPSLNLCKNTESQMYMNLKSVDENTQLLDYRIHNQNDDVNKNHNALNAKLLLTTNDFGWVVGPLIYSSITFYEDIGTDLEDERKEKIESFTSNYFKDPEIKNINDTMTSDVISVGQAGVKVIAEYSLMHFVPTFTTLQQQIEKKLNFTGLDDEIKQGDKDKKEAKSSIMSWLAKKSKSLLSKFTTVISTVVSGSSLITSYILATIIVIANIKALKIAVILGLIAYKTIMYFKDLIIYYFFSILILLRIATNKREENVMYITSKIIYLVLYPIFLTLSVTLLIFIDKFTEWLLYIYLNFQIESMKLTSYVATADQNGFIDTVSTGSEAILKLGVTEGIFQLIILVVVWLSAWGLVIKLPRDLFDLIGNNISPNDELDNKYENKLDKTGI